MYRSKLGTTLLIIFSINQIHWAFFHLKDYLNELKRFELHLMHELCYILMNVSI